MFIVDKYPYRPHLVLIDSHSRPGFPSLFPSLYYLVILPSTIRIYKLGLCSPGLSCLGSTPTFTRDTL